MNKALFLDLDGTIVRTKSGETFPIDSKDWQIIEGIKEAIHEFKDNGYIVCIVTNQGGMSTINPETKKPYVNEEKWFKELINIFKELELDFNDQQIEFHPYNNQDSFRRKPNPGMAYLLAIKHQLSLKDSVMVGDASGLVMISPHNIENYQNGIFITKSTGRRLIENKDACSPHSYYGRAFSDSDRTFAKNSGIGHYFDIDQFIYRSPDKSNINRLKSFAIK